MRVISGSLRGMKLVSPEGIDTRPTLDRVKEAVFSMLLPYLQDSVVLDLFAGTGALGIESLSRGAMSTVFVDNNKAALSCVKTNINNGKLDCRAKIINEDSLSFLKRTDEKFDIIFMDPPYNAMLYSDCLKIISERDLLTEDGLIVAEWDYEFGFTDILYDFQIIKDKKYGRVGIAVLKRG